MSAPTANSKPPSQTGKAIAATLREAVISLLMDIAFKEFAKRTAQKGGDALGNHIKEKFGDFRVQLFLDLREMKEEDKRNLMARYKEAKNEFQDQRFTMLIGKLMKDRTKEERIKILTELNDMGKEEFDLMLYLLEHDVVIQWIQRNLHRAKQFGKDAIAKAEEELKKLVANVMVKAAAIDAAAQQQAPEVHRVADGLEASLGRSRLGRFLKTIHQPQHSKGGQP